MIHSISLLTRIISVAHILVKLPNGESILVTHIGQFQLSTDLVLDNVLCVPSLFQSHFHWQIDTSFKVLLHIPIQFMFYPGLSAMEDNWIG